jgi:hypothetical protein
MSFDWNEKASEDGGGDFAERLPSGLHKVDIVKVVHGGKNGTFESSKGDPQILIIFADQEAREAAQFVTLSDKAGWVLARVLSNCVPPANLGKMTEAGITPQSFADPEFAEANLVGRKLHVNVEWKKSQNGKDYADIVPVNTADYESAVSAARQDVAPSKGDVPF